MLQHIGGVGEKCTFSDGLVSPWGEFVLLH